MATKARRVLDVTVVLLDAGYASTAIGPIEVFHSAGLLWNRLHGEAGEPRFRVRTASIDGKSIGSLCGLRTPELSIRDVRRTDIIVLPASGLEVQERIARNTALLSWLRKWHSAASTSPASAPGLHSSRKAAFSTADKQPAIGPWPSGCASATRKCAGDPNCSSPKTVVCCSGGVYACIDLSLYLVEKFCGHEIALQCARSLLVSMPRSRQSGYAVHRCRARTPTSASARQRSTSSSTSCAACRSTTSPSASA